MFDEKREILDVKNPPNCIYLLLKNEEVVYVGQTTIGLARVFQHRGKKDFDFIKLIPCDECELTELEDRYIAKYQPIYNQTKKKASNYNFLKVKSRIKQHFDITLTLEKFDDILWNLGITKYYVGDTYCISQQDYEKIYTYFEKKKVGR